MTRRNPLAALQRLPGWWLGAATVRIEEASHYPQHSDDYRRHAALAAEYERRAQEIR
jgi:hypothetical protein